MEHWVWHSWDAEAHARNWGLLMGQHRLARLTWADDNIFAAQTREGLREMWNEARDLIHGAGYGIDGSDPEKCAVLTLAGPRWRDVTSPNVEDLTVLGSRWRRGSDRAALDHRQERAQTTFNAMRGLLTRTHVRAWRRFRALRSGVEPVALWGLSAVGVTATAAQALTTQWRRLAGQTSRRTGGQRRLGAISRRALHGACRPQRKFLAGRYSRCLAATAR